MGTAGNTRSPDTTRLDQDTMLQSNIGDTRALTPERENGFSMFPWLICYVWKARNEKCFNAKDISLLDTLQLAQQEDETWKVAQLGDEVTEEGEPSIQRHQSLPPSHTRTDRRYTCQVDGSWAASDEWMGMGFVILEVEEEILQGQICTHRAQSPIHAEAEGIIWAMKEARARVSTISISL
ncbi:hypothetical protein DY000_02042524 [Brassica cretica]|uniref:RNase H type-1 domain-containing protein n=1 Tax=Brassica cretica TaxID=69181 RepID=A0ABQ7B7D6_BRACR|nr:hypothetical protein DY000_02042524 [Brassica cretica]